MIREIYAMVTFKSVAHEKFRVNLEEKEGGVLSIHLEARNSKKQWETCVNETSVKGIPVVAVFKALQVRIIKNQTIV